MDWTYPAAVRVFVRWSWNLRGDCYNPYTVEIDPVVILTLLVVMHRVLFEDLEEPSKVPHIDI